MCSSLRAGSPTLLLFTVAKSRGVPFQQLSKAFKEICVWRGAYVEKTYVDAPASILVGISTNI